MLKMVVAFIVIFFIIRIGIKCRFRILFLYSFYYLFDFFSLDIQTRLVEEGGMDGKREGEMI